MWIAASAGGTFTGLRSPGRCGSPLPAATFALPLPVPLPLATALPLFAEPEPDPDATADPDPEPVAIADPDPEPALTADPEPALAAAPEPALAAADPEPLPSFARSPASPAENPPADPFLVALLLPLPELLTLPDEHAAITKSTQARTPWSYPKRSRATTFRSSLAERWPQAPAIPLPLLPSGPGGVHSFGVTRDHEAQVVLVGSRAQSGGRGIRTHGTLRYTRFPSVHLRPLGHPSVGISMLAEEEGFEPPVLSHI